MSSSQPQSPFLKTQAKKSNVSGINGDPSQIGKTLARPSRPTNINFIKMSTQPVVVQPRFDLAIVSQEALPLARPMPIFI